ncbi:MAG TPA: hypothetical protein VM912_09685 [Terriglobales bacterium]|nr:hypothetical protein [Terriglobales bacterium]
MPLLAPITEELVARVTKRIVEKFHLKRIIALAAMHAANTIQTAIWIFWL